MSPRTAVIVWSVAAPSAIAHGAFNPANQSTAGQTLHGDHAYVFYQVPSDARRLPLEEAAEEARQLARALPRHPAQREMAAVLRQPLLERRPATAVCASGSEPGADLAEYRLAAAHGARSSLPRSAQSC